MRILHAIGPGDVAGAFENWCHGRDVDTETSRTYSGQFFRFCGDHQHEAWVVSSHPDRRMVRGHGLIVENRPKLWTMPSGLKFHVNELLYALSLIITAVRYRPHIVVVDSGTTYWLLLAPLKLLGMRIVASLHNGLWSQDCPPQKLVHRILRTTDRWFWRHIASATLAISPECERQVKRLSGGRHGPIFQYRAQFREQEFAAFTNPPHPAESFVVLFAGRIEEDKGVLDLLQIARSLEAKHPGRVRFDVCGEGTAFDTLKQEQRRLELEQVVRIHGPQAREQLIEFYARCHAVIIPTRGSEGLPKVAAEAVLAGRPVITSRITNVSELLHEAVVEAQPDDLDSYCRAIVLLMSDAAAYRRACGACAEVKHQFVDPARGISAAMARAFTTLHPHRHPEHGPQAEARLDPCGSALESTAGE